MNMDHDAVTHTWNWLYIALSYVIAVVASYLSLELAGRAGGLNQRGARFWLMAQGLALGYGIWSMHFIGMLAFQVDSGVTYNLPVTVLSGLAAVVFLIPAIFVADGGTGTSVPRLVAAGSLAGTGIVIMHYLGMAAMRVSGASFHYQPLYFGLSVLIALSAATVAFGLFRIARSDWARRQQATVLIGLKAAAGLVMGVAIVGMHYTGMAAVQYSVDKAAAGQDNLVNVDSGSLGLSVGLITALLLSLVVVILVSSAPVRDPRQPTSGD